MWSITVVEPALSWLHGLRRTDRKTLVLVSQAIEALKVEGPALGRPLADTVKGSALSNLKELRPGSSGAGKVRVLFVFDPTAASRDLGGWRQGGRLAVLVPDRCAAGRDRVCRSPGTDGQARRRAGR